MFKHVAILAFAVLSAIAAARGLVAFASPADGHGRGFWAEAIAAPAPHPEPAPYETVQGSAASVAKGPDGHYWANAEVNGRWVRFLVDTGASAVALTAADAERLGLDVADLDYARPVTTANGRTQAAAVTLDHVAIGGARIDKVDALVVRDGLGASLLGMSYLGRLSRFEATRTALILRP